jgi:hypothetical protein
LAHEKSHADVERRNLEPMTGIEPAYSAWEVDLKRPGASVPICARR